MVFEWLFGESSKRSRRTSKKVRDGVRVNVNQKSVSYRIGGRRTGATVGRRGVKARVFGIKL